ncbi:hypothetical protein [Azospirillum thermophilum]|uniref:Uncharacterized protein n=1 Tax=Azospirillum thermophilum TaxID=2202148 RepID=A0A2S2CZH0_9PROT|nr:hypothetical protein [Azospirillum thermophilum]AWK89902.1 hypothetical protein DEW08_28205 [Azospirillum thermophilum]
MTGDPRDDRIRALEDALRDVAREAASARSALCENELVIRLDTILARSLGALKETGSGPEA